MKITVNITFDSQDTHPVAQPLSGWQAILDSFARHVKRKVASA